MGGEHPSSFGQSHRSADTFDERDAELRLRALQLLADGGLAVAEGAGGAGDASCLGDGPDDADRRKIEARIGISHPARVSNEMLSVPCEVCRCPIWQATAVWTDELFTRPGQ